MQIPQHGILGSTLIRSLEKKAFLLLGDSVGRGNSTAAGPTPATGTVFQWDAGSSSIVQVGSSDLLEVQAAGATGSQWPRFGINYHEATGFAPTFINCAVGGTFWWHTSGGALSWYTNGTLFSNAVTKCNNALAALNKTEPDGVFIILGVNDAAQVSYTLDYAFSTSLIDRIIAEWGAVPIYIGIPDKAAADATDNIRLIKMRIFCRNLARDYANVEVAGNIHMIRVWDSATYFQGDEFHLTFAGNDLLGAQLAKHLTTSASFHKSTRSIIGGLFDDISTARKTAINNFIVSQDAVGNLYQIDNLFFYKQASAKNAQLDWSFSQAGFYSGTTFVANTSIDTNGSTDRIGGPALVAGMDDANINTDAIIGVRIVDCNFAAGTPGVLFGLRENASGGIIDLQQNAASDIRWRMGHTSAAITYAGLTKFDSNNLYSMARDGGTERLFVNGSQVASSVTAAVSMGAAIPRSLSVGARTNVATIDSHLAAEYVYMFYAKYSTFNLSSFYNDMETLIAAW